MSTTGSASSAYGAGSAGASSRGLTLPGLVIVSFVPTAVMMLLWAIVFDGIGFIPNLVWAIVSIFCAWRVRRSDLLAAVIAPPLVYAASVLVAALALQGSSGGLLLNLGATLGEYLALGAPWLFGVTLICFIIIVVRGRTGR